MSTPLGKSLERLWHNYNICSLLEEMDASRGNDFAVVFRKRRLDD
jgi:hypothetical protein